jgi:hypothetical protein
MRFAVLAGQAVFCPVSGGGVLRFEECIGVSFQYTHHCATKSRQVHYPAGQDKIHHPADHSR